MWRRGCGGALLKKKMISDAQTAGADITSTHFGYFHTYEDEFFILKGVEYSNIRKLTSQKQIFNMGTMNSLAV